MTLRPLETGLCTLVMAAAATGVYGQFTTEPDSAPDLRLAIPRPPTSGTHDVGMALGGIAGGDPAASQSWGFEPGEGFTTAPGFTSAARSAGAGLPRARSKATSTTPTPSP